MVRLKRIAVFLLTFVFFTMVYAEIDREYKSWEIKKQMGDKIYIRFQINIPFTLEFLKKKQASLEKKVGENETAELKKELEAVKGYIEVIEENKPVQKVWISGTFNEWKVGNSRIPNELSPEEKNPDTYYTKTLIPFNKGENEYKFVISYGNITNSDGKITARIVVVDDPTVGIE